MSAPFNLNFIIPVSPIIAGIDLNSLVPYVAPVILPVDDERELHQSIFPKLKAAERRRCAELKKLSACLGDEVIHFVVGFPLEDYKQGAFTEIMRRHRVRMAVCDLIRSVEREHDAVKVESLVAMHLDSEIPHVHVAMSRYASDGPLTKRINTLPPAVLPLN